MPSWDHLFLEQQPTDFRTSGSEPGASEILRRELVEEAVVVQYLGAKRLALQEVRNQGGPMEFGWFNRFWKPYRKVLKSSVWVMGSWKNTSSHACMG